MSDGACISARGKPSKRGYGTVCRNGRRYKAHAVAWEEASGSPIPRGMFVCHVCDQKMCIRNDGHGVYVVDGVEYERWGHLWLGTPTANARDMVLKGRQSPPPHPSGDAHYARRHPEKLARGDRSVFRLRPELRHQWPTGVWPAKGVDRVV